MTSCFAQGPFSANKAFNDAAASSLLQFRFLCSNASSKSTACESRLHCSARQLLLLITSTLARCTKDSHHFQLFVLPDEVRVLAVNVKLSGVVQTRGCAAMLGGCLHPTSLIAPSSRCSRLAAPVYTKRPTRVSVDPVQCIWDGSKRFRYKDYTGRIYREVCPVKSNTPAEASWFVAF